MTNNTTTRTRIAPSPTGYPHIGTIYQALFNYAYARRYDGSFLIRIEDTDQARFVEGAEDVIFQAIDWFRLTEDESPRKDGPHTPYRQSERLELYSKYAKELIEKEGAYYCFCTKERLDEMRKKLQAEKKPLRYDRHCRMLSANDVAQKMAENSPYVVRLKIPDEKTIVVRDEIRGDVSFNSGEIDEQVLLKSDGFPTYHLAVVVDDHLMKITHVIRGNEYLSSTPKYNFLYDAFGWERPQYMHLTPIMKDATRKLSKRYGDVNFDDFLKKGYLPHAIVNYIALLGWSPKDNQEKFTLEELIENFSISGLSKSSSVFDENKMKWLNGEYIKELDFETFMEYATPFFEISNIKGLYDYRKLGVLLQSRIEIFSEIPEKVNFLAEFKKFDNELYFNKKLKIDENLARVVIDKSIDVLSQVENWNEDNLHQAVKDISESLQLKTGQVYTVLRVGLTGVTVTPGGSVEMADILGKEESMRRLSKSKEWLN